MYLRTCKISINELASPHRYVCTTDVQKAVGPGSAKEYSTYTGCLVTKVIWLRKTVNAHIIRPFHRRPLAQALPGKRPSLSYYNSVIKLGYNSCAFRGRVVRHMTVQAKTKFGLTAT